MKYCFDIDGTICSTDCEYIDAVPYKQVIDKINQLYDEDHYIQIFTSRGTESGADWRDFTEGQLFRWNVKYHKLIMGKPSYDLFVDDRTVNAKVWNKENNLEIE
jgi:uncharacterized HAD superfamily protein